MISTLLALLAWILWPDIGEVILANAAVPFIISAIVSTILSLALSAAMAPNIKGPKQKDPGWQTSEYGAPLNKSWGPQNRFAGTVGWYSGLKQRKQRESGSGGSQTTYAYSCSAAIMLADARPDRAYVGVKRIWANKKLIYNGDDPVFDVMGNIPQPWDTMVFYPGSATQMPDPTIVAKLGVGNVPAYRHTCYVVITNLQLADFGPILPNLEFELIADDEVTVIEAIQSIALNSGITINTDKLELNTGFLAGYTINQEMSPNEALAPIASAHHFDVAELGDGLHCIPRGMKARTTIPAGDLGAFANGREATASIEYERSPDFEIPQEVAVSFYDYERDLQINTARARYEAGNHKSNISLVLPITLTPDQGLAIAQRILWGIRFSSVKGTVSLSEKWIRLVPGDVIRIPGPRGLLPFLINRILHGANGVLQLDVTYEDAGAYPDIVPLTSSHTPAPGPGGEGGSAQPGPTTMILLDIPILRDAHDDAGFYRAGSGSIDAWTGYSALRSTDGGTDYESIVDTAGGCSMGDVEGIVPDGPIDVWDRTTVIRLTLLNANKELDTISEASVYNGGNGLWIGNPETGHGEILQFMTATFVSAGVYDVSDLLRGRRGTEWAVGTHGPNEMFVVLADSANIGRHDFGATDWDAERLYKAVTIGRSASEVTAQAFTNTGEGKRPFSPAHLVGRWDREVDDLKVSWFRRTRLAPTGIGAATPLGEDSETYQLDFHEPADPWVLGDSIADNEIRRHQSAVDYRWRYYRARSAHTATTNNEPNETDNNWTNRWARVAPLRTVTVTRPEFVYTSAFQAADGHVVGDPLEFQCRQRSSSRDYGRPTLSIA